jgi:hypothetical protein
MDPYGGMGGMGGMGGGYGGYGGGGYGKKWITNKITLYIASASEIRNGQHYSF